MSAVLLLGAGLALPAFAKITCCEANGQRYCGDPVPPQCYDKARKEFGKGGATKEIEAPLTAEQAAAREAEKERKKEEERKAAEQKRRDRALLDSYTAEQDIDKARDRAIADIEKNAEQAKNRLESAQKKQQKLEGEKEFYKNKPLPAALAAQIKDNEAEIAAQQKALAQKDADIAAVRERYDADKQRYLQLKSKK
jgi:hypothetical protein